MLMKKERPDAAYQAISRPLAEMIPWMSLLTDDLVLNKDGSLLACFEFESMDVEGLEALEVNTLSERVEIAMRNMDAQMTLWWRVERRSYDAYIDDGPISNEAANAVDKAWRKTFKSKNFYRNTHFLSVVVKPSKGTGRFFDTFGRLSAQGMSAAKAVIETLKISFRGNDQFVYEAEEIAQTAMHFQARIDQFWATLNLIKPKRLTGDALLAFLHRTTSPTNEQSSVKIDPYNEYLDTMLGDAPIEVHRSHLQFGGNQPCCAVGGSIKGWPSYTQPGIMDALLRADAEFTLTYAYRIIDNEEAKKYIIDLRRHNENFSKSLFTYLKENLMSQEVGSVDNTRMVAYEEADDALTELGQNGAAGFLLTSLLAYGKDRDEAERGYAACMKILQKEGFIVLRENIHLLSAWSSSLPGQFDDAVRWVFVSGANHSDIAPLRGIRIGSPYNAYLSQQRQKKSPALSIFDTEFMTPYFFSFHESDLPHALVVGPSRSGKSIFNNFLISQWLRYDPCQVFIFDKDLTCRIPTYMHGGRHLWMGREKVTINPFASVESESDKQWLSNWVEGLIEARSYQIKAEDAKSIWQAIEQVFHSSNTHRRLSTLEVMLPKHLANELQMWVGTGQKSSFFDHDEDAFTLSSFTTMEMGGMFDDPIAARAFLDYAFHKIQKRLDGRPTLIYIEEAWFMLEDEKFAHKVNDWLRTLAKKNAMLLMTTQSLEEIARSHAFIAMVDNIPNRIFLSNPNARASEELYCKRFGLNSVQLERIRTATPKREYYISTPKMSRMVDAQFPPEILAYLRSDAHAQKIFDETRELFKDNWKEAYYERIKGNK